MTLADEIERSGAFRDVIRASNRQESEIARLRDAFAAKSNRGERKLKLYHGTSLDAALRIESQGFQASATGCLGPGVYLARADKALRFAQEGGRHGGAEGGLVEVLVRFKNPKFVAADDDTWQAEGYDACRAEETSASQNMEWCVLHPSHTRPNFRVAVLLKYRSNAHDVVEGTYADDPGPIGSLRKLLGGR
ncbi:hypothetical protein EMIHUDRAFT_235497 [Emiliania huxleyi CCMP1516]|uniref:PARP n=2 Tax=Emiliania huxleyi TaxID=2903 RepID=A0A0D3JVU4_EMIH1|nr:hypothetical protein EMIHUDRAFT_235497 [Emiliania huxleyi CCMP1516]EOD27629.1 hypothetical protein EMIHUDRAFT_235497 [Emiliania huxleyi CCMP1516]|eukprot:XP_005780058.1 hypothetical protein EMIHUDRAFT_235497 [Emiliania huxleyi CCMP1516]